MQQKNQPERLAACSKQVNKWRAYAKGKKGREYTPLRNTKEEALADLSVAREGATDARDVARGLAVVRILSHKQKRGLAVIGPPTSDNEGVEPSAKHACNMSTFLFYDFLNVCFHHMFLNNIFRFAHTNVLFKDCGAKQIVNQIDFDY